jgi:hypothetical protein
MILRKRLIVKSGCPTIFVTNVSDIVTFGIVARDVGESLEEILERPGATPVGPALVVVHEELILLDELDKQRAFVEELGVGDGVGVRH